MKVDSSRKFRYSRNSVHVSRTAVSLGYNTDSRRFREHDKSCRYQWLSFEIIVARCVSGMQAFENIGTLSDQEQPYAVHSSFSLLFFLVSFLCPRNSGHSSPLFSSFLWPKAPFKSSKCSCLVHLSRSFG